MSIALSICNLSNIYDFQLTYYYCNLSLEAVASGVTFMRFLNEELEGGNGWQMSTKNKILSSICVLLWHTVTSWILTRTVVNVSIVLDLPERFDWRNRSRSVYFRNVKSYVQFIIKTHLEIIHICIWLLWQVLMELCLHNWLLKEKLQFYFSIYKIYFAFSLLLQIICKFQKRATII